MALTEGTRLGPYEIQGAIGAGGMGEVYKAQDTRLGRTVAVKIMPGHLSAQEDMKARFEREAQTIAGLNHPNICTLHDVGHESPGEGQEPIDFLVLEYIEGETLTERIGRGAIPLAEALKIGIDIADALDKAHRQGIVHRDLKPANVMISTTGPKLLDFGLAKWTESGEAGGAALPTRADVTAKGTMLGTLQYMAPEQVEGKEADARTDIFAFAALLYEMVTGKRAFEGKSQATLISAIMGREPRPMSHLVPVSPPALEHVVERALAKDPDERWQTAHSLVIQLKWIAYGDAEGGIALASPEDLKRERMMMIALAAIALLAVTLAVPAFLQFRGPESGGPFIYRSPVRGYQEGALAPDGSALVFVARPSDGSAALYYRPIGGLTSVRLDGTNDAAQPFWSPDSQFVGFVAGGSLKKIDVTGGPAQILAQVSGFTGGTCNQADTILFGSSGGLHRVSAEGGAAEGVTTVEAPETGHFWPRFLPDGVHYVFLAWSGEETERALYAGSLDAPDRTRLLTLESHAAYAEPGYLLYQRETAVYAQPFDAGSLALSGEAVRLAGGVSFDGANGRGSFDVSQTGSLMYFEGGAGNVAGGRGENSQGQFGWLTRSGGIQEPVGEAGPYGDMDLSPDGSLVAVTRVDGTGDIWIIDWQRGVQGVPTRLTLDAGNDINPIWSPDGTQVAFSSDRNGNMDVFVMNANGVGAAEPLLSSESQEMVEAWSRDGEYLAYLSGTGTQSDIWVLPLSGDREPFPIVEGPFDKDEPQFSHDGKWVAYTSNESGEFEVYVMSFPEGDQREKASVGGGGQPRWSPDGTELFYRAARGSALSVAITAEPQLDIGSPQQLFSLGFQTGYSSDPTRHQWAVSPDGQRFLARSPHLAGRGGASAGGPAAAPMNFTPAGATAGTAPTGRGAPVPNFGLTVILNWPASTRQEDR